MRLQDRLQGFLKHIGLNPRQFEISVGLANGTCSRICESTRKSTFDRIANAYPQLNLDWLRTGEGEMLTNPNGGGGYLPHNTILERLMESSTIYPMVIGMVLC